MSISPSLPSPLYKKAYDVYPEYRIAVCKHCYKGVIPTNISGHLAEHHHDIFNPGERSAVYQEIAKLNVLAQNVGEISMPSVLPEGIPGMAINNGAYLCIRRDDETNEICNKVYINEYYTKRHIRENHSSLQIGRIRRGRNPEWKYPVKWHDVFHQPLWNIRIAIVPSAEGNSSGSENETTAVALESRMGLIRAKLANSRVQQDLTAIKETVNASHDEDIKRANSWMRYNKFATMLDGRNIQWLRTLIATPDPETEIGLLRLCAVLKDLIVSAQDDCPEPRTPRALLQFANHKMYGGSGSKLPFRYWIGSNTIDRYAVVWRRLVCYVWRALPYLRDPKEYAKNNYHTGNDDFKFPESRLRDVQLQQFEAIVAGCNAEYGSENEDWEAAADRIKKGLHGFLLNLFQEQLLGSDVKNVLIASLAIQCLHEGGHWRIANEFTPILSAVITVSKMLVLSYAYRYRIMLPDLPRPQGGKSNEEQEDDNGREDGAIAQEVWNQWCWGREFIRKWMRTSTEDRGEQVGDFATGAFNVVVEMRSYGKAIARHTPRPPTIRWETNAYDTYILHTNVRLGMKELQQMVAQITSDTRELLLRSLLLIPDRRGSRNSSGSACDSGDEDSNAKHHRNWAREHEIPPIAWTELVDDKSKRSTGHSLFNMSDKMSPNYKHLKAGEEWLMSRIVEEPKLSTKYVLDVQTQHGVEPRFHEAVLSEYRNSVTNFLEHLLVLMHLTGGSPARAPELLTVMHRNDRYGHSRGIFLDDGLMVFVTLYHKSFNIKANSKAIHRYVPREVGELLFYYLWLVVPFIEEVHVLHGFNDFPAENVYLWPQYGSFERTSNKAVGAKRRDRRVPIDIQLFRPTFWTDSKVSDALWRVTVAAGKSPERGFRMLQYRHLFTGIVRRQILHNSLKSCTIHEAEQQMRELFPGIEDDDEQQQNDDGPTAADDDETDILEHNVIKPIAHPRDQQQVKLLLNNAFEGQMSHSNAQVGQINYGRTTEMFNLLLGDHAMHYRTSSLVWHKFLGFPSTRDGWDGLSTDVPRPFNDTIEEQYARRKSELAATDIDAALTQLYENNDVQYRGKQREAVEQVMRGASPLIAVLPTGTGKSVLFMLPAHCNPASVTVVITPLLLLRLDISRRCKEVNLSSYEWKNQTPPPNRVSIVLVTPDASVTQPFLDWAYSERRAGRLDRIVFDEAHMVFSYIRFRPCYKFLYKLIRIGAQMVYLSATIPVRRVTEFEDLMHISTAPNPVWVRESSIKASISYRVFMYDRARNRELRESDLDVKIRIVKHIIQTATDHPSEDIRNGQILVFVESVDLADELAEAFNHYGAQSIHAQLPKKVKEERFDFLIDGTVYLTFSTAIGAVGVDSKYVRTVGTLSTRRDDRRHDEMEFLQHGGRGSRGLNISLAILCHPAFVDSDGVVEPDVVNLSEDMRLLITERTCRRQALELAFDGVERIETCFESEEKCDLCLLRVVERAPSPVSSGWEIRPYERVVNGERVQKKLYWRNEYDSSGDTCGIEFRPTPGMEEYVVESEVEEDEVEEVEVVEVHDGGRGAEDGKAETDDKVDKQGRENEGEEQRTAVEDAEDVDENWTLVAEEASALGLEDIFNTTTSQVLATPTVFRTPATRKRKSPVENDEAIARKMQKSLAAIEDQIRELKKKAVVSSYRRPLAPINREVQTPPTSSYSTRQIAVPIETEDSIRSILASAELLQEFRDFQDFRAMKASQVMQQGNNKRQTSPTPRSQSAGQDQLGILEPQSKKSNAEIASSRVKQWQASQTQARIIPAAAAVIRAPALSPANIATAITCTPARRTEANTTPTEAVTIAIPGFVPASALMAPFRTWAQAEDAAVVSSISARQQLADILSFWNGGCYLCRCRGSADANNHQVTNRCPEADRQQFVNFMWEKERTIRKDFLWERFAACVTCGAPQALCAKFSLRPKSTDTYNRDANQDCTYHRVATSIVSALFYVHERMVTEWISARIEEDVAANRYHCRNRPSDFGWLFKKYKFGDMDASNLCRLLLVFAPRFMDNEK
jgi:hypothetical protein